MSERFISVEELAEHIGIKPNTIRLWAWQGKIPHYKCGGRLRFSLVEVLEYMRRRPKRKNGGQNEKCGNVSEMGN